jgi:hypothetical protein
MLLSNKHSYMFVTRKKPPPKKKTNKQCKQDISIYHEQINKCHRCVFTYYHLLYQTIITRSFDKADKYVTTVAPCQ